MMLLKNDKFSRIYPVLRESAFAVFFFVLALIPFLVPLFSEFGALQWDAREVHLTNLIFSSHTWHAGFAPLWSPHIFNGFPQIADMQVAVFYPINLLIGLFFTFGQGLLLWQIVLHYALAGFGMFLLVRHVSKSYLGGLFSGIAYMFSGFMLGHASHVGMQNTAAWLPIVILLALYTFKKQRWPYAIFTGTAAGIAILAGHFQTAVFVLFTLCAYFAFDMGMSWRRERKIAWNKLLLFICIGVVTFLISAVQLFPTFELTKQSQRAAISLEIAQTESLAPQSLRGLFTANYHNAASGEYSGPWDRTQNYLFLGITTLALALTCLLLIRRIKNPFVWFLAPLGYVALLYSLGKYSFLHKYFYLLPLFDKMRAPSNMMLVFDFAVIVLAGIGLTALYRAFPKARIFFVLMIVVLLAELLPYAITSELLYARKEQNTLFTKPWIVQNIEQEYNEVDKLSRFRLYRVPELDRNLAQVFGIDDFSGYNPLTTQRQAAYEDAMVKNPSLIDLGSVKYLPCEYITSRAAALPKNGNLCINTTYFPRAFFVDAYVVAQDGDDALARVIEVDLKKTVVLETDPQLPYDATPFMSSVAAQENNNPNEMRMRVTANKAALLFMNQSYYPGWTAFVDGKTQEVFRANYL
ncbi:MAG: YfhO family protein, partial [Candidatus Azambacteria bacterium]|nr:YfhO family protein [Candidatus Azambacteria bacterium]